MLFKVLRAPPSIQQRLSLGLVGVLIVAGLCLAQLSLWVLDQGLRRYLHSHLQNEADTLLAAIVRGSDGLALEPQRLSASYQRQYSGEYFVIVLPERQWRSRSSWDYALPLPEHKGAQKKLTSGPQQQQLLVNRSDFRRYGQAITIVTAQDYTPMLASFKRVQWLGGAVGLLALLLVVIIQRYFVRRALLPLDTVREQIVQLQQGQRSQLDQPIATEIAPLVAQINHLLRHTEETLNRSRNAMGNLGHALKTPLAVLFSVSNRPELAALPELQAQLRQQLQQMQERISRELARARLAGDVLPGAYFVCERELPDLCSTLEQIHGNHLHVQWQAEANLRLPWDREDMLELLGNLLDNACKWAQQNVQLTIALQAGYYQLLIDDDGPGIAPEQRQQVLERGARLDEQVQGHGLGLGIVRDIVEHCGGTLTLAQSPLGGLRVEVMLPRH